uniref:Uncharacterized protein n=1 Tax=Candidatus Kentrum sp. TC TaxID=2126339 RepID=A0A451ACW3_9GAMM|nr:MAG: hypothetical protein BECKTC1821F_GA0114240_11089 [Candidatus Kentron sp. TC]
MPLVKRGEEESYLFSITANGRYALGDKDNIPVALVGTALAPFTSGLSLIVSGMAFVHQIQENKIRENSKYRKDYVGVILERQPMNFNSTIGSASTLRDGRSIDFLCPYCTKGKILTITNKFQFESLKIVKDTCSVCERSFYWFITEDSELIVLKSWRASKWIKLKD